MSLGFYSWMERGLATFLFEDSGGDDVAAVQGSPTVRGEVELREQGAGNRTAKVPFVFELVTPGHVVGIEPGIVTRAWPKAGVTDAETDYFPVVEFADADFPWRYSPEPGRESTGGPSVRSPWIALVVLADDEIDYTPAGPSRKLPSITVHDANVSLPTHSELSLWAHVQVSGGLPPNLLSTLRTEPQRVLSRLVCPRFLAPKLRYRAFLVPTYESGRRAGLGQPVTTVDEPAWPAPPRPDGQAHPPVTVELPVYYEWSFLTGNVGSFLDLARRLVPRRLGGPGTREMDVSKPGLPGLENKATRVQVGGALRPIGGGTFSWTERATWRAALAPIVNAPEVVLDPTGQQPNPPPKPTLAPPLYGRWYADVRTIAGGELGEPRAWFQDLNESPHYRVPAALGTAAIQKDQQALMASAWQQVDGLLQANQQIRQAQLSREASLQSYRRHVTPARRSGRLMQLAGAVFGRVLTATSQTVLEAVRRSPIPDGFFEPAWRRLTRPLGSLGRRQGRPGRSLPPRGQDTLDQVNTGELDPAAPKPPPLPDGAVGPGPDSPARCPSCLSPEVAAAIARLSLRDAYLLGEALFLEGQLYAGYGTLWRIALMRLGARIVEAAATPGGLPVFGDRVLRECYGLPAPEDLENAPPVGGGWTPAEPVPDQTGTPPAPGEGTTPSAQETAFRNAADVLLEVLNAPPLQAPVLTPMDLTRAVEVILAAIDPRQAIAEALRSRLSSEPHWAPADRLEPLLVVPTFPQAMYEALRDISTEWILPGIGEIPANTVGMLLTNQAFLEAYMVGLNHEMGRELLWHEYPNDLRGTYFRQFWDVRGRMKAENDEGRNDVKPVHDWGTAALGANSSRVPVDKLVLFVRGDLLDRYPQVVVYMAKASGPLGGGGPPHPLPPSEPPSEPTELYPLFRGKLGSDAGIHGFGIEDDIARGHATQPGWYVVLQEPHAEPRFGIPANGEPSLVPRPFLDRAHAKFSVITSGPEISSGLVAQKLYRQPVRVAFHASLMLPPPTP